jgi:hypothetical protein
MAVETDLQSGRALLLRFRRQAKRAEARRRLFGVTRGANRRRQRRRMGYASQQAFAGDRIGAAEAFRAARHRGDRIEAEPAGDDVLRGLRAVGTPGFALAAGVGRRAFGATMKARLLLAGGTCAAGA